MGGLNSFNTANFKTLSIPSLLSVGSQPNLSQYFGGGGSDEVSNLTAPASFFDQLSSSSVDGGDGDAGDENLGIDPQETAVLHSCRESRLDLPNMTALQLDEKAASSSSGAKIDVAEQVYDDARSLARRQSHDGESRRHHHSSISERPEAPVSIAATVPEVCNVFTTSDIGDPFDTILTDQQQPDEVPETRPEPPTTLPTIAVAEPLTSPPHSHAGQSFSVDGPLLSILTC